MSVRTATKNDLPRIIELGSRSLVDGPYAGIIQNKPDCAREFAERVLNGGTILLGEENEKTVGLLGFIVTPHHFSGQLYASELMWYVEPEHRKGGIGLQLLWEAERRAKKQGAETMIFSAPNDSVAALYKRFGYEQLEVSYRKVL
jgi:GNAT superfamily N-acetyltransferase